MKNNWIPASQPPKEHEWVLACVKQHGVPQCLTLAIYGDGKWNDDEDEPYNPDYWMPIPGFEESQLLDGMDEAANEKYPLDGTEFDKNYIRDMKMKRQAFKAGAEWVINSRK